MPSHSPVSEFIANTASAGWNNLFPALDRFCNQSVGHKLFSCSIFEIDAVGNGTAARIYTSDEESYPVSGLKDMVANRWTKLVVEQHETFVANSIAEISDVFPDYEKIASLGLGSVINLPVIFKGQFLGTVNMLHDEGYYTEERLEAVNELFLPALVAFKTMGLSDGNGNG